MKACHMRAAVCRNFAQPLDIETITLAAPGPGEMEVAVKAVAICHSDITYMDGKWGGRLPAVYGHEAAGVVTKLGTGVGRFKVGDRVAVTLIRSCGHCYYCDAGNQVQCESSFALTERDAIALQDGTAWQGMQTGAFAEAVLVDQSQVVPIPDDLSFDIACLLSCGVLTGFGAVTNTAAMPSGASCAVVGCGGVGLNAIQAASLQGARHIIAIDIEPGKRDMALRFGATHALDARLPDLADQVRGISDGRGLDYVFVTVGLKSVMDEAHRLLAKAGTVVLVGMPASGEETQFDAATFAALGHKIIGSKMGSARISRDIPALIALYKQGRLKLDALISNRYRFEDINAAITDARQGKSLRNVIVFDD